MQRVQPVGEMKHAYLIMAHNEFDVLQKLIDVIDDKRNDIYVHIDARVKKLPNIHCRQSNLQMLKGNARVRVYWATSSQIEAELSLFRQAYYRGKYSYYHLISGVHLPLKSQGFLHEFYDSCYDKQVLHLMQNTPREATDLKLRRYHFFVRLFRNKHTWICRVGLFISNVLLFFQKRLGIFRPQGLYAKSENWVSITEKAVAHLLENAPQILREYRFTFCGDEYFVASEFIRNPKKFSIRDTQNMLLTDFVGPSPRCYRNEDFEYLVSSECLFARKFSSQHIDIVNRITDYIANKDEKRR